MKIAYVGNFTQRHCTEVHLAFTLEQLGHEVIRLQENELTKDWVSKLPSDTDMVMYTRTWGGYVTLGDLEQLRERKIPTVSYHLDLYVGLSRKYLHEDKTLEEVLQTDPFWRTDFVFTPDGDPKSAEVFRKNNVNHYYMKAGVFEPECYIYGEQHPEIDVLFVGGGDTPGSPHAYGHPEWNYRNELIQWLKNTYKDRFTKFGHPQETIRNNELNMLYYNASKVVVGDSVCIGFNHENYWSDRVYETIGRGGFLIHPYIKGLEEEFTDGETIVFYEYGNFDQLKEKIDYYLEHDDERERIRKAGHEFVKKNATYTQRLQQMLKIVDPNYYPLTKLNTRPLKINLGAGSEPTEGWVNVDWINGVGIDVIHNLFNMPFPFEDGVAEEIKAIDVLEHMPVVTSDGKAYAIDFIEECWRILQNGGKLTIQVPHHQSPNLWKDPTHVRGYDLESFDYFDPDKDLGKWYGYYTKNKFKVESELSHMVDGSPSNVTFTMIKVNHEN